MSDPLLEALRAQSFRRGTFTLASGKTSDFFIDCKATALRAKGHALVGEALLARVRAESAAAVAGVALGGCSLASAVAFASTTDGGAPIDAVYVRKAAKGHGTGQRIEGGQHLGAEARIVLCEDTVTTGGSSLRAVEALRDAGYVVVRVLALVDRREGAAETFAQAGVAFDALYGREDFL